jgi:hypothetical protein
MKAFVTAWRSPRAPAEPWGWWPAPRHLAYRKTGDEAASTFALRTRRRIGSFVRFISNVISTGGQPVGIAAVHYDFIITLC